MGPKGSNFLEIREGKLNENETMDDMDDGDDRDDCDS